ncbi:MAG: TPM domain-containing protein [Agathobacter sp.]|nr:TPM domain-containing protein [Agathobacter sp.]
MRKHIKALQIMAFALFFCFTLTTTVFASDSNSSLSEPVTYIQDSGYGVYIEDNANLLTLSEENDLRKTMEPITAHGNVVFLSIDDNPNYSAEDYAEDYGYAHFGTASYIIVLIDMDYREICVYSDGAIYKTVTSAYARSITDNIYRYASDGDYYNCAYHAFDQINTLLEGKRIAQPMKYISNALLAIVLALLINYFIVMHVSRSVKASNAELLNGIYTKVDINNPRTEFLHQTKKYSPQSSSSSGARSVGRSGGGFSGGGGGSRGGGGSHRF